MQNPLISDSKARPIVSHRQIDVVDFVVTRGQTGVTERIMR
jgi:hypothetical protein